MARSLEEIVAKKLDRLEEVPDQFVTSIDRHQKRIYGEIIDLLESLDREDGNIVISEKNIAKIETIMNRMSEVFFDKEYIRALTTFASEFDKQATVNDAMFKAGFDEVPDEKLFKDIVKATKKNAIALFNEQAISQEFFQPLRNALTTSIVSGASFKDTISTIRTLTLGSDDLNVEGLVQSHAKTYARTSFSMADRSYTQEVSKSITVEFYKYSGSEIETTRPFCEARHGKYFHKKEIESWGELKPWAGWIKGTDPKTIFVNLGGWNCRHSLIPVSVYQVPIAVVMRAIAEGYYEPPEQVKKRLGIAA